MGEGEEDGGWGDVLSVAVVRQQSKVHVDVC